MRIAEQKDLDGFRNKAINNPDIFPYLSTGQYISESVASKDDWGSVKMINDSLTCLLSASISRDEENVLNVCIWSESPFAAGRCVLIVKDLVKQYNARAIESVVHESNKKSIEFNKKLLGEPWGTEPMGAWNRLTGKWEGLVYFRKVIR